MRLCIAISLVLFLITGCKKKNDINWDKNRSYTVQGYYFNKETEKPFVGVGLAISENGINYSTNEPYGFTDSSGYFSIKYKPSNDGRYIDLHPRHNDYSCVYGDNSLLNNLPKGQDLNLGIIYNIH